MLSVEDNAFAQFVLQGMTEILEDSGFSKTQFDNEVMSYLQFLNKERGLELDEMMKLTSSVGIRMDLKVNLIEV